MNTEAYDNYIRELNMEELHAEIERQRDILDASKDYNIKLRAHNKWMLCRHRLFYMRNGK